MAITLPWMTALLAASVTVLAWVIGKGYRARVFMNDLRKRGLSMPEFSWIAGHMKAIGTVLQTLPRDVHTSILVAELASQTPNHDAFYLDLWPFYWPILVLTSPSTAKQATQDLHLDKPRAVDHLFKPITGGPNLFTMPAEQWRPWRSMYNPGFSQSYLLDRLPDIVREVSVFCEVLRAHAQQGDLFPLEEAALRLTVDVIGVITLDTRMHYQRGYNRLAVALRRQIRWNRHYSAMNPFRRWNPFYVIGQFFNGFIMRRYIEAELDKRFAERQRDGAAGRASRSVVALALDSYLAERRQGKASGGGMDKTFRAYATYQTRLFLFAGHDTTSSTLSYCYHLLSTHPDAMSRLRAEHDQVLGTDLAQVPSLLVDQPHLLNQLPYTLAVIKEATRLFPPASGLRQGVPGTDIIDEAGTPYPTAGVHVWVVHRALQRNPKYWPSPDAFLPERWLVGPDDPLYPVKGAWRPFEFGPRNCIGQTLAMMELRMVLVMTAREFDVKTAYDEWDRVHPRRGIKTVRGERAYEIESGGAHPVAGMPCRVRLRHDGAVA